MSWDILSKHLRIGFLFLKEKYDSLIINQYYIGLKYWNKIPLVS